MSGQTKAICKTKWWAQIMKLSFPEETKRDTLLIETLLWINWPYVLCGKRKCLGRFSRMRRMHFYRHGSKLQNWSIWNCLEPPLNCSPNHNIFAKLHAESFCRYVSVNNNVQNKRQKTRNKHRLTRLLVENPWFLYIKNNTNQVAGKNFNA